MLNSDSCLPLFDDSDMSPEETYLAVLAAWDQDADPGLDAYQDYKQQ